MTIRNVDECPYSEKHGLYGGASGLKDGLIIDNENWMVKFPKNAKELARHEEMEYTNDPTSEYLASHIYEILGVPVHETMLVERYGKVAVACKDFCINDTDKLLEIRTIKNSANQKLAEELERSFSSTGTTHSVNLEEILLHLKYNDILTAVPGIKERFWDMLIIDIFTNNSDRNNGNWGILRSKGKPDRLAPVFDNGGAFNGKTPDSRLSKMLNNENALIGNVTGGQTTFCDREEKPILAKDMLQADYDGLKDAIIRITPKIRKASGRIQQLIDSIPNRACSEVRKTFYKKTLELRQELLLEPALEHVIQEKVTTLYKKADSIDEWRVLNLFHPLSKVKEEEGKLLRKEAKDLLLCLNRPENVIDRLPDDMRKHVQKGLPSYLGGAASGSNDDHDEMI